MVGASLWVVCLTSFVVVFVVLAFMAAIMRLLIKIFPEAISKVDAATLAAITTVISTHYPGTRITEIKETQ